MTESTTQGLSTRSIHGSGVKDAAGSPHVPIYNTTTFAFPSTADLLDVVDGRKAGALYTRYGLNPSIFALEETLAGVEGAEAAWAFCSRVSRRMASRLDSAFSTITRAFLSAAMILSISFSTRTPPGSRAPSKAAVANY